MDKGTLAQRHETMQPSDQIEHLLSLSFNLTVVARNTYVVGRDEVDRPKALRGIVEISHKIIGRVLSVSDEEFTIPVSDFWDTVFATADIYGCRFELENAIAFSEKS